MNQAEFLIDLAALLRKHKVAICCPGVTFPPGYTENNITKVYSHIEFIDIGSKEREVIASTRMHVTAYDVNKMIKQLKYTAWK